MVLKRNFYTSDHSLRLFEYLPIGTPETKHGALYYLEDCIVVPYSTDVRPCCFTLKMRDGTEIWCVFSVHQLPVQVIHLFGGLQFERRI